MLRQLISRIRRNHGLEHATIHLLREKHQGFSAQGNSNARVFYLNLYGDIPHNAVTEAVVEAHRRMKGGEHHLAVHPDCGTVLFTTAMMATLSGQAVLLAEQWRQGEEGSSAETVLDSLPKAILATIVALIISRPIGLYLQKNYTVEGDLQELQLVKVRKIRPNLISHLFHVLLTAGKKSLPIHAYFVETAG